MQELSNRREQDFESDEDEFYTLGDFTSVRLNFDEIESENSVFNDELEPGSELDSDECEAEIIWIILEDPLLYLLTWPKIYLFDFCRGGCQGMDALHQNRKKSPITHEIF